MAKMKPTFLRIFQVDAGITYKLSIGIAFKAYSLPYRYRIVRFDFGPWWLELEWLVTNKRIDDWSHSRLIRAIPTPIEYDKINNTYYRRDF